MAKFFGKKQVLLGTLIVALGAAVYLNYYFAKTPSVPADNGTVSQSEQKETDNNKKLGEAINVNTPQTGKEDFADHETVEDYFQQARKNRENARNEATALVKDLMNSVKITDEEKAKATADVLAMAKAVEQESKIESLIKAKGFSDCVVYIEGDKCSVVVKSNGLTVQDTAKISQIVTSQSDVPAQNMNIVTAN